MNTSEFLTALRVEAPATVPVIEEHGRDSEQLLPHPLFGDLTRLLVQMNVQRSPQIEPALSLLDAAWETGDEALRNCVAVSFLENLSPYDGDGENAKKLIAKLSPTLRREHKRFYPDFGD